MDKGIIWGCVRILSKHIFEGLHAVLAFCLTSWTFFRILRRIMQKQSWLAVGVAFIAILILLLSVKVEGKENPKIWLREYKIEKSSKSVLTGNIFLEEAVKETEWIVRNGSDYLLKGKVRYFVFVCEAGYPVQWRFPFPAQFGNWDGETFSYRRVENHHVGRVEPKTKYFQVIAVFRNVSLSRAEITCENVDNMKVKSTIQINCEGHKANGTKEEIFTPKWRMEKEASFEMRRDTYGGSVLECCSGINGSLPFVDMEVCQSVTQCDYLRVKLATRFQEGKESGELERKQKEERGYGRRNCSRKVDKRNGAAMIGLCFGENVEVGVEYLTLVKPLLNYQEMKTYDRELTTYARTPEVWNAKLEERALVRMGIPGNKDSMTKPNEFHLETFQGRIAASKLLEYSEEEGYIREVSEVFAVEREKIQFLCVYSKMWYSVGAQIQLTWRNGSTKFLKRERKRMNVMFYNKMHNFHNGEELYGVFSKELEADKEMSLVECHLPIWNTTGWDKVSWKMKFV